MRPWQHRSSVTAPSVALALLLVAAGPLQPLCAQTTEARDRVLLTNGKEVRGRIVRIDDKAVTVRIGSRDRVIPRGEILSVVCVASEQRDFLETWQDTDPTDANAVLALAKRADAAGLPHEAALMRWYAVLQRPGDAATHTALGNRQKGKTFLVPIDGEWVPFAEADALGVDFDKGWRLRSEHFAIRCAAGLRAGLDALLELEGLYQACHQLFGQELGLFELVEPIDVRLYRTRAQMPNLSNTVGAYFSTDEPALYTCMEQGRPYALMHEGTHAVLHHFFVRAAKSRGALPAWLDEGWAEYMEGRLQTRVPGKVKVLDGSVMGFHSAAMAEGARSKSLYGVHRLLNFKATDFGASTKQDLKYAQSWALFRYLFENEDEDLRKLFVDYLRESAAGQGQASTFRRIFSRYEKQLETAPFVP